MGSETERAQVAAIAAVLALALVVVSVALTQAVVVPQQNERAEIQHQQAIEEDMLDVRAAVLGSAETASGQTATVRLGTTYPERTILRNPQQPQGSLRIESLGAGSLSNAVAANPETTDFWSGTVRGGYTNSRVLYDPGYNYYEDAPQSAYESSVLYRGGGDGMTMQSGQRLVDGKQLSLAFVDGERDLSRTGTTTIEPETLSASEVNVDLRSPNAEPVTVRIPTRVPESAWADLLASELDPAGTDPDAYVRSYSCTASSPDAPCGTLTLKLEPGVTYDAKLSKVGLTGSVSEPAAYVTALRNPDPIDEGKQRQFTVQVRDRYNNPVSGVDLDIIQPSVGRVVGPVNSVGEVGAVTDENGRATFTYRAPVNVPVEGATATLGVEAGSIHGDKGRVTYDIGVEDTAEQVSDDRMPPLVTAVSPNVESAESGDFVRVDVTDADGLDPSNYTLDLVNRDGSVRNTVALSGSLDRAGVAGGDEEIYFAGERNRVLRDIADARNVPLTGLTSVTDVTVDEVTRGPVDIYVVGPNAADATFTPEAPGATTLTGLEAFAARNGLDGDDVVVRSSALAPDAGASLVDGTIRDELSDADPGDGDAFTDVLDDQRGTVLLRQDAAVVDTFAYRSEGGQIAGVQPAGPGGNAADEHVELRFERPTDLLDGANHTLSVVADGHRETVDLGGVADGGPVTGSVYVIGDDVDRVTFATEQGVTADRVVYASALAQAGLAGDEFVPDSGGTVRLHDGPPDEGELVDERPYDGIRRADIGAVVPLDATGSGSPSVSTDEYARLDFGTTVDTTGWQLLVDDGDGTTERLDLTPLADTTGAAPGPVYLVGEGVDPDAFASARGIAADRVVSAATLAEGDLADSDLFDDDGASLTLQDVAGDTVDTYAYGTGPASRIADVTPRDATGAGGATDEFLRLDVDRAFDSAGWTLAIDGPGRVGRLDLGVPAARDTIAAGEDVYLVGRAVDRDRFAADRGVDPSQVVPIGAVAEPGLGMNALPEPGATLRLRDASDRLVDRYEYGSPSTGGGPSAAGAVTTVDPSRGGDPGAEFARLDFTGPVDTATGWSVVVERTTAGPGTATATYALTDPSVADAARTGGTVYLVGNGIDPDTFADERGVAASQVFRFDDAAVPVTDGDPTPEDVLSDLGGELRLQDAGGTTVDSAAWTGRANGRIDAVTADTDGDFPGGNGATGADRDGWVRVGFPGGTDTTDWTLTVDGAGAAGDATTLDLGAADGPARDGDAVYVAGDVDGDGDVDATDVDRLADAEGVPGDQVFRAGALASGGLPASFLADDGGTVTLRDATGAAVDTYAYGSELRSGSIATVEARDATTATGDESSDEYVRLDFERPVDTTGYELTVQRPGTDGERRVAVPLDEASTTVAVAGGPIYLVGETVDETRFAAGHGVTADRVVVIDGRDGQLGALADSDVLTDTGATLTLRGDLDGDGTAETELDRYAYGTEAPRTGDWEHTFTGGTEDTTAYRERDDAGQYIDTDTADDWYDTGTLPGEDPQPASANVTVDEVATTGSDVDGDGVEETTGVTVDLSNGDGTAEVVGFATETDLASAVDAGGDREVDVPVDGGDDGFANAGSSGDADASFAADGTRYRFANLDSLPGYDAENATVPADATFEFEVGEYRTDDGSAADLGTLVPATAGDADLSVTLVFADGSTQRVHLRQRPADIDVDVTADKPAVGDGSEVTFSTTVENLGPGRTTGPIRVSDGYDPAQFEIVSSSPAGGATYDPGSGTWTIPDGLPAGENHTLNVTMRASGSTGEALPYTVARTESAVEDPNVDNDVDTASVTIGGADPYLEMTSPQDPDGDGIARVDSGDTVTFDLTVGNRGPGDIPGGLVVRDELPAGFVPLSHEATAGTYDPATGDWRLSGGLAEGTTETLTIRAVASPVPGPLDNTATIADVGAAGDRNTSNNEATVTVAELERPPGSGDGGDDGDGGDGSDGGDPPAVCSDPTNLDGDETVLLWSTFETRGDDDAERLANASWSASGEGIAGVNDLTSESCGRSAYTADGERNVTSPTVDTDDYDLVEVAYWVQNGSADYTADLPGAVSPSEAPGPTASEDLAVEFYGADGEWHRVDRIEQDDPALADGALERRVYLPGSLASHDGFRLRFHQLDGDQDDAGTDDFWHVDNVRIVGGPDDDGGIEPIVTGTTPVDGGDGDDGNQADDEEDDDNGHGNDCDTDPSNPSGNDPPGQEEDCENDGGSDEEDGDEESNDDDGECEVEEDDGSPGTDDRGIGNNAGETDPDNPALGSSWEGEADDGCEEGSDGTRGGGIVDATFGYDNTYPGAVYLTPGPELPTRLFEPGERNDVRVNRTSDPVGDEGPSVVETSGVSFGVSDTDRYVLGGGTGLPGRFPAGSPDDVVTVSGLDGEQLVSWYLGDDVATAGGAGEGGGEHGEDRDECEDDDGDNGHGNNEGDDCSNPGNDDADDSDGDSGSGNDDDSDDSDDGTRRAISFVAACPAGDDIDSFDITVTETKDGGEPVAIEWTSDEPVETVVLKAGTSMETFDAGGATSGTAAVGGGTAAGSTRTPSSPCPDGDGLKYEWDGGSFDAASDGEEDDD
ncbi:hypothetical protein [Haloglomus litoreum]|uniref:hypothetical protein n=1 Tax=Haloglomus litoreum TaxID=3034026 RepID=UPI0023E7E152|nr:hypothetical protein [Haloglomus sp. DT116]